MCRHGFEHRDTCPPPADSAIRAARKYVLAYALEMAQNVTLKLSKETIRGAKIVAAKRGMSISSLLAAKIEELVGEDARYQAARRRALEWLSQGWHLSGGSRI